MSPQRLGGAALLVTGVVLFVIGVNASHSVADRWSNFFSGHFTDSTMWYMLAGIVAGVVGSLLLAFGGGKIRP